MLVFEPLEPTVNRPALHVVPPGKLGLCDAVLVRNRRQEPWCRILLFDVEKQYYRFSIWISFRWSMTIVTAK